MFSPVPYEFGLLKFMGLFAGGDLNGYTEVRTPLPHVSNLFVHPIKGAKTKEVSTKECEPSESWNSLQ